MLKNICALSGRRGAAVAVMLLAAGCATPGPDPNAAVPADAIFARKIMMDTIDNQMNEVEGMLAATDGLDLAEARDHADVISVMLMAFPHLFPPGTNQWRPNIARDAGRDTYASPELWTNFAQFRARAGEASKVAYRASRAKQAGEFKVLIAELRSACNACHALYLKTD
jgi:cytochrome c556